MYHIAVVEEIGGRITRSLEEVLDNTPDLDRILVTRTDKGNCLEDYYDFIVISGQTEDIETWCCCEKMSCGILLVPGKYASRAANTCSPECIVAYGMGTRDTITLSSIEEKSAVVALQRELLTLERTVLERQEIPVKSASFTSAEELMAIVGSLLIMGIDAGKPLEYMLERLCNVFFK